MSDPTDPVQILRDYLYVDVDVDKVKSIAGQLEFGVPEESRLTTRDSTKRSFGWEKVLSYSPGSEEETYLNRSMLDSLFPDLESALNDGWLTDISEEFSQGGESAFNQIKAKCPPASIFRLTADGFLFDSRYLGENFASLSTAISGFQSFQREYSRDAQADPQKRSKTRPGNGPAKRPAKPAVESGTLEDQVEDFTNEYGYSPEIIRSLVKMSRGLFSPGLNLVLFSEGVERITLTAQLQENRRYLDAPPGTIGSRFGGMAQRWTIVGTVGHYTEEPASVALSSLVDTVTTNEDDKFSRIKFIRMTNRMIQQFGNVGLANMPQYPGISAIPIGVYRVATRKTN